MSRHLGNLIGNVHAFHHFTKYRVTEITLTMVKEGVIGNVDKEWLVALSLSAVRAIAMVPRVLRRPLSASFLIGGFGFFCCICSVKPPP
ncbi:Uncharacterised protein [Escherichia coli]|uniref:Uncharacterized protein n=1 Tax=Escherichia coli TaxID=562 RepID=A0A376TWM5_ECOLX|nr:Uncharacterised protein [Escherichia coli]